MLLLPLLQAPETQMMFRTPLTMGMIQMEILLTTQPILQLQDHQVWQFLKRPLSRRTAETQLQIEGTLLIMS